MVDDLLIEWYEWSASYRPALGVPKVAPCCRGSASTPHYSDEPDTARHAVMRAVDGCIDKLDVRHRKAINTEMRNAVARVWRCENASTYQEAVEALTPLLKRAGLI